MSAIESLVGFVAKKGIGKIPVVGTAYSIVSLFKGVVDDDIKNKLNDVRESEGCLHIKAVSLEYYSAQYIGAQQAAAAGYSVWQAPNLLWCFHEQPNYRPIHARRDKMFITKPSGWGNPEPGWSGSSCFKCAATNAQRNRLKGL